jgi:ABC-type multidrug transport system fused ATPase/permease subunit
MGMHRQGCVLLLQDFYVWVYAILVVVLIVARMFEAVLFASLTTRASRVLHNQCFVRVLDGTMAYFDTTPLGRILNRFSGVVAVALCTVVELRQSCVVVHVSLSGPGDLDQLDTRLPDILEMALQYLIQCVLSLVVVATVLPWFLVPMAPIMVVFIYVAR